MHQISYSEPIQLGVGRLNHSEQYQVGADPAGPPRPVIHCLGAIECFVHKDQELGGMPCFIAPADSSTGWRLGHVFAESEKSAQVPRSPFRDLQNERQNTALC